MQAIMDIIDLLGGKLGDLSSSELVIGEPIVLGKVTVVTLSRVSLSLAGGGGEGEGNHAHNKQRGRGSGHSLGGGVGAKVRPVGVVLFTEAGVEVHPIPDQKGPVEKLLDRLPEIIERVKSAKEG